MTLVNANQSYSEILLHIHKMNPHVLLEGT